jgi:hypothetical protein
MYTPSNKQDIPINPYITTTLRLKILILMFTSVCLTW